ncbi:MAG TPA: TRAP transporter permease [Burkholderiaceae bacterium]|nr:TRAP transporter permease [Burkholderiaceae bacterium]
MVSHASMHDANLGNPVPEVEVDELGHQRSLTGKAALVFAAFALVFSFYQLIVAAFSPLSSQVIRSLHVGFLMMLAFMIFPMTKAAVGKKIPWYDWGLALTGFALGFYHWYFETDLILRAGSPTVVDLVVGSVVLLLLFESCRRILGLALPLICGAFLLYGMFGEYLPGALAHRPYYFDQIISQMYLGVEGIYGLPTLVSATYIFLFILFGSFLEQAGMIRLFNNLALGFVGHSRGGPAKVAVISSGFMGTISGSGVANVLTVGQFTIPLMKRFGYSSVFAGAVEATASMGGQIMPPVMGAVAFIMAETLNVPYLEICKAAVIPAVLYYVTAFWMVHLEAGRAGLLGLPKEDCPNPWKSMKEYWYLLLPLGVLVFMLFDGFTPMFAGLTGLGLTATLILGANITASISPMAFRFFFWIVIGLAAADFFKHGIWVIIGVIAALAISCLFVKGGKQTLTLIRDGLINGAKQALPVGLACAIVGIIIGILTLTGAATSFAGFILEVGQKSLFLSLLLTMVVCLILGMGIPTIPNYIITSSIAAPALLKLGVPLIVSHMFVFYFGIMADLTPPVALAALAASSIAKASFMRIAIRATQIAIAGFVIPYMAVYDPSLMMQGGAWYDTAYMVFKALVAITLWGGASVGFLLAPLSWPQRALSAVASLSLVVASVWTDQVGFGLAILLLLWHWPAARQHKRLQRQPA